MGVDHNFIVAIKDSQKWTKHLKGYSQGKGPEGGGVFKFMAKFHDNINEKEGITALTGISAEEIIAIGCPILFRWVIYKELKNTDIEQINDFCLFPLSSSLHKHPIQLMKHLRELSEKFGAQNVLIIEWSDEMHANYRDRD